jgi:hypothetical protein
VLRCRVSFTFANVLLQIVVVLDIGPGDAAIFKVSPRNNGYLVDPKVHGCYTIEAQQYTGRHAVHVSVVPNVAAEPVQYVIDTSVGSLALTCVRIAWLGYVKCLKE